jgi:hypothetical protein
VLGHGLTPNDGHIALGAFVTGMVPKWAMKPAVELGQRPVGAFKTASAQTFKPNLTAGISAVPHEKSGFGQYEGEGMVCPHPRVR